MHLLDEDLAWSLNTSKLEEKNASFRAKAVARREKKQNEYIRTPARADSWAAY